MSGLVFGFLGWDLGVWTCIFGVWTCFFCFWICFSCHVGCDYGVRARGPGTLGRERERVDLDQGPGPGPADRGPGPADPGLGIRAWGGPRPRSYQGDVNHLALYTGVYSHLVWHDGWVHFRVFL